MKHLAKRLQELEAASTDHRPTIYWAGSPMANHQPGQPVFCVRWANDAEEATMDPSSIEAANV